MIGQLRSHLAVLRYTITRSFWFVPGLMSAGAVLLALLTASVGSEGILERLIRDNDLIAASPEAARTILATTVGSIITVTSLVFSMVLVALGRAQQQLGPRLLQEFTGDTVNQVVLGAFVATFIHALLTLAIAHEPVPAVAVCTSILLVLGCFVLLIYFLHHTASFMQADQVLARVRRELIAGIEASWPATAPATPDPATPADEQGAMLLSGQTGYVQSVDNERLVAAATRHDGLIRLDLRPGHFVLAGAPLGRIWPASCLAACGEQASESVAIGAVRTAVQDLEFSIKAMVEIALRALSPGINDPYTALAAIDQLSGGLAVAMARHAPPGVLAGPDGRPRLLRDRATFTGLIDAAYNPIRQSLGGNVTGIIRLIDALGELAAFARDDEHRDALRRHLEMMGALAERTVADPRDLEDIRRRLALARRCVAADDRG